MLALIKAVQELIEINNKQQLEANLSDINRFQMGLLSGRIQAYNTAIDLLSHITPKYKIDQIVYLVCFSINGKYVVDNRRIYKILDYQIKITKDTHNIAYDIFDMEDLVSMVEVSENKLYSTQEEAETIVTKLNEERLKTCSSTDEI